MSEKPSKAPANLIPWLVTAKVIPPKRHVILAERVTLLDMLRRHQSCSLTIMEAPGGFGKSTLLALWRSELLKSGSTVAWLTLEDDDSASALIMYLAYAFHLAGIDMDTTNILAGNGSSPDDLLHHLGLFISILQSTDKKLVLMLDDAERLIDDEAVQLLNTLVRHAPDNLHIAIAFRQNPGIILSNLLLDGAAIRLTAQDLRFSYDEIDEFFGRRLSRHDMKTVHERTEGWPVALRLIKSEIENTRDYRDYIDRIRHFSGESGLASEYFAEQVFARLTKTEQAFLLDASVLEWLEAPLIDAIRETSDARHILDDLSHLEGVIVPLDGQEDTYRLHALFREFLVNNNRRENNSRFMDLQRRAAKVLAKRSRLLTALRHANQAGDKILVGEILEHAGGVKLWLREGMTRVIPANQLIDDDVIREFPRLGLLRCIVLTKGGHLKDAQTLYNQLEKKTSGFQKDRKGGDDKALYLDHIFIRSMLAAYGCLSLNDDLISELLPEDVEILQDDAITMAYRKTVLCLANHQRAEFSRAWRFGKEAIGHFHQAGSEYGELFIDFHFGSIAMVRGETQDAANHYIKAQRNARRHFPRDQGLRLIGEILAAELNLERNQIKRFKSKLGNITQRLHDSEAWFDIYAAAYSVVAEVTLEEDGLNDTLAFLTEATRWAEEQGVAKLSSYLAAVRVSVLVSNGNIEQALLLHDKADLPVSAEAIFNLENHTWREAEIFACSLLLIQIASGAFGEGRKIISAFLKFTERKNLVRPLIRCLVLAATLEDGANKRDAALRYLSQALKYSRHTDYIRPFLRAGTQITDLLTCYTNEPGDKDQIIQAEKILSHFQLSQGTDASALVFSPREIDVLQGLNRGLQDKMIAINLGVTPHAVRYHLKNIYVKINASNRMQAVNKARKMGVFEETE